jgi:hypothetical protein
MESAAYRQLIARRAARTCCRGAAEAEVGAAGMHTACQKAAMTAGMSRGYEVMPPSGRHRATGIGGPQEGHEGGAGLLAGAQPRVLGAAGARPSSLGGDHLGRRSDVTDRHGRLGDLAPRPPARQPPRYNKTVRSPSVANFCNPDADGEPDRRLPLPPPWDWAQISPTACAYYSAVLRPTGRNGPHPCIWRPTWPGQLCVSRKVSRSISGAPVRPMFRAARSLATCSGRWRAIGGLSRMRL